jgi:hypothetical protein
MKLAPLVLALALLAPLPCCTRGVVRDSWDKYRALAAKTAQPAAAPDPTGPANPNEGWAILLETFDGHKQSERADRLVKRLRGDLSLPDIWQKSDGKKTYVYRGQYADASTDAARSDLRQTRMIVLDGVRPYEAVELVPLGDESRGGAGAMDLRQFAGRNLFTLQVAAFDEAYGKDFRKAAEHYAAELRAKGQAAFYYHGHFLSLVTIGLFTDDDFKEVEVTQPTSRGVSRFKQRVYGPRMEEAQKAYPLNLFNGYTVVEKMPDGTTREQPSFIVPAGGQ